MEEQWKLYEIISQPRGIADKAPESGEARIEISATTPMRRRGGLRKCKGTDRVMLSGNDLFRWISELELYFSEIKSIVSIDKYSRLVGRR